MMTKIIKLDELKGNVTFSKLDELQSKLDNEDSTILAAGITRSLFHALTFLIAFASLNEEQKKYVVNNINKLSNFAEYITVKELNILIEGIEWNKILLNDPNSPLLFHFTIALANPNIFLDNIQANCSPLFDVLSKSDSVISTTEPDIVTFTTQVNQNVLWKQPFNKENNYWSVPEFVLSKDLKEAIENMEIGDKREIGTLSIVRDENKAIELLIKIPAQDDSGGVYRSKTELSVNKGIYDAFIGLLSFCGLERVDDVEVNLNTTTELSATGANAEQTQVVTCTLESFCVKKYTTITIDNLTVFYDLIGVAVAFFKNSLKLTEGVDSSRYYICLPTSDGREKFRILSSPMLPLEAHNLNFNVTSNSLININQTGKDLALTSLCYDREKYNKFQDDLGYAEDTFQKVETNIRNIQAKLRFFDQKTKALEKGEKIPSNEFEKETIDNINEFNELVSWYKVIKNNNKDEPTEESVEKLQLDSLIINKKIEEFLPNLAESVRCSAKEHFQKMQARIFRIEKKIPELNLSKEKSEYITGKIKNNNILCKEIRGKFKEIEQENDSNIKTLLSSISKIVKIKEEILSILESINKIEDKYNIPPIKRKNIPTEGTDLTPNNRL